MYIVKNRYNDSLFNGSYAECRMFVKANNELMFITRERWFKLLLILIVVQLLYQRKDNHGQSYNEDKQRCL